MKFECQRDPRPRIAAPCGVIALCLLGWAVSMPLGCSPGDEAPQPDPPAFDFLEPPPPRVVSLSPLATRFVLELGAGRLLAGVDPASSTLPGLEDLPVVDLDGARRLAPDWILAPSPPPSEPPFGSIADERVPSERQWGGARWIEFAPHDLEDVIASVRELGAELVGPTAALSFERRLSRPLALIAGDASPIDRPRVVAIVGFDPLLLAGGHSFETDLIEIAGGTSVTHGGDETRIAMIPGDWRALDPDLVLVMSAREMTREEEDAARAQLPADLPVELFVFDAEHFWLDQPEEVALRLRDLIASRARLR